MDFVPFEIAKKLKEKGFEQNYNIFGYKLVFSDENTIKYISDVGAYENEYFGINIPCPAISQVLKWLRKEKYIHINTSVYKDESEDADGRIIEKWCFWNWDIQNCNSGDVLQDGDDIEYESYELAAIAGIEYCLDNLI